MTKYDKRLREIARLNGKVERTIRRWFWFKNGERYKAICARVEFYRRAK